MSQNIVFLFGTKHRSFFVGWTKLGSDTKPLDIKDSKDYIVLTLLEVSSQAIVDSGTVSLFALTSDLTNQKQEQKNSNCETSWLV